MSDWSRWFNKPKEGKSFSDIKEEGNLSAVLPGGPAERARQLGLQSNGRGSYIDPNTGQVAARTVNNELVFYDQNGGAIADSSGGSQLSRAQPSWGDPITGMLVTPPGKAESPAEIASIPDAVPATPPAGYNDFMKRKKDQQYQMNAIQPQPMRQTPDEAEEQEQQQQDMTPDQGQAFGEDVDVKQPTFGSHLKKMMAAQQKDREQAAQQPSPADAMAAGIEARKGDVSPEGLAKAVKKTGGVPERMADRIAAMRQRRREAMAGQAAPEREGEAQPSREIDEKRKEALNKALENILANPEIKRGAGKNNLSHDDARAFQKYIKEGPQNQRHPVTEDELEYAMNFLQEKAGPKWKNLMARLNRKGGPPPELLRTSRGREILSSYLENLGQSAIDGSPLRFSESELDHNLALDAGGEDNAENWRWLPTRFNNFKSSKSDEALLSALEERLAIDPEDESLKLRAQELKNKVRGDWRDRFERMGPAGLNIADIRGMKGAEGLQVLKALAEKSGISHYKTAPPRASGRISTTALPVGELQDRIIKELGIPEQSDIDSWDKNMFDILQGIEDQRADLARDKRRRALDLKSKNK